jgi:Tfp pilus assembly protein PilN
MMSSPDKQPYDDRLLTRYLLGALPEEEAERLDELCIVDDDLATRLHALENDLVDAYVRGEVSGEDLRHFESFYMSSAKRRQKVDFAAALLELEKRRAAAPAPVPQEAAIPRKELAPAFKSPGRRALFRWGFAFAAAAMLLVAGFLLLENSRLRKQMSDAQMQQATLDQRGQELQKQLDDQRAANAEFQKEIARLRQSQTNLEQLKTIALLLPPPTRGAARVPAISVPPGTDVALLLLALESDDFPAYRAALKDSATRQIVWNSGGLEPSSLGERRAVSISVPANLLKPQNYIVELTGLPTRGAPESVGGYPFRVVLK